MVRITHFYTRLALIGFMMLALGYLSQPAHSQPTPTTLYLPAIQTSRPYWAFIYREAEAPTDKQSYALQATRDGGYILAGGTNPTYAQVIKLNGQGQPQWAHNFGGDEDNEGAMAVLSTRDGNFVAAGFSYSYGAGDSDGWVFKLDRAGEIMWQQTFGWTSYDLFLDVAETPDGGLILAGAADPLANQNIDMWAMKLDANGAPLWQKHFDKGGWDNATSILPSPDGGYVLVGFTQATFFADRDIWVIKLDAGGEVVWDKTYGGNSWDEAQDVAIGAQGEIVLAGDTESFGAGDSDGWVLKLDANGAPLWQKAFGGSGADSFHAVALRHDGGIVVAGEGNVQNFTQADAWVMSLTSDGAILWKERLGGFAGDYANDVHFVGDDLILTGATGSYGVGTLDTWGMKLDMDGQIPGCGLMRNDQSTASDTQANIQSGTVTAQSTPVEGVNSSATPLDANLQAVLLCGGDRVGLACLVEP